MNDNQLPKPTPPTQPANQNSGIAGNQNQPTQVAPQAAAENELPPPSAMRTGSPVENSRQNPVPAQQQPQLKQTPMPPTSLSALSSMTSTNLPEDRNVKPETPEVKAPSRQGDIRAQLSLPRSQAPVAPSVPSAADNSSAPAAAPSEKQKAKFAKPKSPLMKYLPFVGAGILILALAGFAAMKFLGGNSGGSVNPDVPGGGAAGGGTAAPPQRTTIEYWGLWEPDEVMSEVISGFESENPGITINYVKQSHKDYRQRLQTAIASGNGPDLFRYHATWVPMLQDDLAAVPSSVISAADFKQRYYPIAAEQLQSNGQIVGVPAMYDGLALLYNKEVFTSVNENPPQTWAEVRVLANKLTVKSDNKITRAGIALGTTSNVDHFSDILATLMLQNGANLASPNSAYTRDALLFYTNFATQDRVWDQTLPNSTVAFARGDVAMIFAPSWRIHEILAMNPELEIGVAPMPILGEQKITWATYWAEGMSARSNKKEAAAKFLKYLTSEEVLMKFYSAASETRSFGELYPQQSMASQLSDNEMITPYLQDAPSAKSWYLSSATHDNGINDQMIKYYEDAVNAIVNDNKGAADVLGTLEQGTKQVLRQYNVSSN